MSIDVNMSMSVEVGFGLRRAGSVPVGRRSVGSAVSSVEVGFDWRRHDKDERLIKTSQCGAKV